MSNTSSYTSIEFNGVALHPSFSIYLFEIVKNDKEKFFYVGMTGDNHYPSARSILHRLAGHISLLNNSTQNQFIVGLKKVFGKKENTFTKDELGQLNIKLHTWHIDGFTKWEGSLKYFNKNNKTSKEYKEYENMQQKVLALENKIIFNFHSRLLNKTKGIDSNLEEDYLKIYNEIKLIIEQ